MYTSIGPQPQPQCIILYESEFLICRTLPVILVVLVWLNKAK